MVSLTLHAVHSWAILLITLIAVADAAPLESHGSSVPSHQRLNTSAAPYGFTTRERVNKTILLNHGAAENQVTYILRLRQHEFITAIIHISTDPTIITATSETRQQLPVRSQNAVNFTLLHEFDGRVGTAQYSFLVFTNVTEYRATGMYTVAGIVVYASEQRTPASIASGMNSPGLAFKPSLENSTSGGILHLEVEYQPVGSDITGKPPSLIQVLSNANVDVKDIMYGTNSTLVSYNDSCSLIKPSMTAMNGSKQSMRCGICFNGTDQTLRVTVNPERSGSSIIQISLPYIEVGDEIFETDIRVFVKRPPLVNPVVLIQPGTKMLLDYYGTEVFYLQMYNIIQPDQPVNATDFFVDLDMNRYASADLSLSRFEQPIQTIAFVVQPPGKEDMAILKKIQAALMSLKGSELDSPEKTPDVLSSMEPIPTMGLPTDEALAPAKFSIDPFNIEITSASRIEGEYPTVRMPQVGINVPPPIEHLRISSMPFHAVYVRMNDDEDYYESNAHVIIPPALSLRTAKNVLNNPFLTMFAPNETAVISSGPRHGDSEHVLISLFLVGYSTATFSEHKSRQVSMSLTEVIRNAEDERMVNGNLTLLKANDTGIQVTYAIPVAKDAERIARHVLQNKTEFGNQVARAIWIPLDRLALTNAMVYDPSSPSVTDVVSTPEGFLAGLSGPLLAIIIALVLVALIPLAVLCIGHIMSGTESVPSSPVDSTSASFPRVSVILRDTLGRATEDGDQESFKMDEGMRQQGYYTDNNPPREQ